MTELHLKASNAVPGVRINEYQFQGSFFIAPHVHDSLRLGFLMRGAYSGDGDENLEMAGPALVYYPALTRTGAAFHNAVQHFLWIDIERGWLDQMALSRGLPVRPGVTSDQPVLDLATTLKLALPSIGAAHPIEVESIIYELLKTLNEGESFVGARPQWWRDALNILHEDKSAISLTGVAETLQLHPAHLARAFKAHAGCAIGEYNRRLRLSRAARDLAGTAKPIAEIATERGFFDQSHFNRHFKRAYGLAPSQFRVSRS